MIALQFALALWLFSTIVAGVATFTNSNYAGITAGQPFDITWTGASSAVTLKLVSGPVSSLTTVLIIGTGLTGTSFIWTPPTSLSSSTYAFEILHGNDVNYSIQFTLSGGGAGGQSSAAASESNIPSQISTTLPVTTAPQTTAPPTSSSPITAPSTAIASSHAATRPTTTSPQTNTPPTTSSPLITTPSTTTTSSLTPTSSVSSPTGTVQSISDGGLGTGAKAGIGVGIVLGAAIVIFVIWLISRRRRIQRKERIRRDAENGGVNSPEKGPEMMTSANTHEIDGKPAADPQIAEVEGQISTKGEEVDSQYGSPIVPGGGFIDRNTMRGAGELEARHPQVLPELGSENRPVVRRALPSEMQTQSNVHEMAAATSVGSDWEHLRPSELDSKAIDKPISESSVPIVASKAPFSAPTKSQETEPIVEPSPSTPVLPSINSGPDELEALQRRMEQVRADKERLERIQQLKDLEVELQRDIMAEQKRRQDAASGS